MEELLVWLVGGLSVYIPSVWLYMPYGLYEGLFYECDGSST